MPQPPHELYLVTDRHAVANTDLVNAVSAAVAGGTRLVQLREKDLDGPALHELGARLREVTATAGALLFVNSAGDPARIAFAAELEADGVHLTSQDLHDESILEALREARARRSPLRIAASTHDPAELTAAEALGADLATLGPVFDTPSKRDLGAPIGLPALGDAAAASSLAVYALGGVGPEEVAGVVNAGAVGVGCIRAVLAATDPEAAARMLIERVRSARLACPRPETPETP